MKPTTLALAALLAAAPAHRASAGDGYRLRPHVMHVTSTGPKATMRAPSAVAIGDVTGDGRADVVMTTDYAYDTENAYRVIVFAQDADGVLAEPLRIGYGQINSQSGNGIALGDFDGQAGLDVAVGGRQGVSVLHAVATPPWLAFAELRGAERSQSLATLDVYGNGRADLVSVGRIDGGTLFENRGAGLFTARRWRIESIDPVSLAAGDIDNDGDSDVAVTGYGQLTNVRVYRNERDGQMTEVAAFASRCGNWSAENVGIGDVNGDGIRDIVTTAGGNTPEGCVQVFRGLGATRYATPQTLASSDIPQGFVVTDIDRDGRDDIVVTHPGHTHIGIYRQRDDGTLASERLYYVPHTSRQGAQNIAVGDFTGDGCNDVALTGYGGLVTLTGEGPGCDGIFFGTFD